MEPNNLSMNSGRANAKDFFLNLGVIVALYATVISLINLLFIVINSAYPQITTGYNYYGSQSISWPVAVLIIIFPIFLALSWFLEKGYVSEPEKKNLPVRRWLTYITLFVAGVVLAGDLVTVLYYYLDGQELTTGFFLKVLVLFVVTLGVFLYYISDIRGKLTAKSQKMWLIVSCLVIILSIIWGFSVLGSPRTQRLIKYDEQKVYDLQNMNSNIINYYQINRVLPDDYATVTITDYIVTPKDPGQTGTSTYEYKKTGNLSYELCAEFNMDSDKTDPKIRPYVDSMPYGGTSWSHPAGHYCFPMTINPLQYPKPISY